MSGVFNIATDVFKMALIHARYDQVGMLTDAAYRAVYYWDIVDYEAENSLYPEGGKELDGKSIVADPATGITTISFDDITFESAPNSNYFDVDLWTEYAGNWNRESVLGVIYSDTAKNKPIIQISVIHSPNTKRFLSNGAKHTIKSPQVRL